MAAHQGPVFRRDFTSVVVFSGLRQRSGSFVAVYFWLVVVFMQAEYKSKMCHYDPPFAVFKGAANRNRVTTFTALTGREWDELVWVKNKTKKPSKNKKNE